MADLESIKTLRRVPHLTVTWAHQPASPNQTFSPNYQPNTSPSYSLHVQPRDMSLQFSSSPNSTHSRCRPTKVGIEAIDASIPTTDQHFSPTASESAPIRVQCIQDTEPAEAKKHNPLLEPIEQMQDLDLADRQACGNSLQVFKLDTDRDASASAEDFKDSPQEYPGFVVYCISVDTGNLYDLIEKMRTFLKTWMGVTLRSCIFLKLLL